VHPCALMGMGRDGVTTSDERRPAVSAHGRDVDIGFEELYVAVYDRLVHLARLTSAETVPAEEIVQDAFIQLYRRWSTVEHPEGYLRVAVLNGCRSWGRRRVLARRHDPPPVRSIGHEEGVALRDALRILSPRQRAAVVLRYFEDLKEAEIAELLGCRPGTVKSLLSRSMSKLKGVLHDD
jgi:RNA polymerase sigma-70 factor (sigma-E family)